MSAQLLDSSGLWAWWETDGPTGSLKDRIAEPILTARSPSAGDTVIEASSGNTAVALAALCGQLGLPFVAVVPASTRVDKVRRISLAGARVLFSPADEGTAGAVALARELADLQGWVYTDQHRSPANPTSHEVDTAPAIARAFPGLTHVVVGMGTTGTFVGLARYFVRQGDVQVVGVRPTEGLTVDGLQYRPAAGQPLWEVPITARTSESLVAAHDIGAAHQFAQTAGIAPGRSGYAVLAVARRLLVSAGPGSTVVAVLADSAAHRVPAAQGSTHRFKGRVTAAGDLVLGGGEEVFLRRRGTGVEVLTGAPLLLSDEVLRDEGHDPETYEALHCGRWVRLVPNPAARWVAVETVAVRGGLREILEWSPVEEHGPEQLRIAASLAAME